MKVPALYNTSCEPKSAQHFPTSDKPKKILPRRPQRTRSFIKVFLAILARFAVQKFPYKKQGFNFYVPKLPSIRDEDINGLLYTDFADDFRCFTEFSVPSVSSVYLKKFIPNSG
jgi:hypothetical protein